MENRPTPQAPEGCLTIAIRVPVRIVVLVLVVPVRIVWDLLATGAKALRRVVLAPLWRALVVIPFGWLYACVLTPLGRATAWLGRVVGAGIGWLGRGVAWVAVTLVAAPAVWAHRTVLAPLGRGVARVARGTGLGLRWLLWAVFVWPPVTLWRWVLAPLLRYGLVVPGAWLYRYVLTPAGHAIALLVALARAGLAAVGRGFAALIVLLFVVPVVWAYRTLLTPLGRAVVVVLREIGDAIGHAWRVAGFVSRAVGRALERLARNLLGRPARWVYAVLLTPVGHWMREAVLRPAKRAALTAGRSAREALASARETVRTARRDAWRALVGGPPREPAEHRARTLGSTTTASGAVPAPEISLSKAEG
ncbi:hypothetical protein [Streptomyces violascens]|uniref:Integral membrane protein n=1 Tax=Streptomyces violascens TaxID=67381 RepID=A0ABQ3QP54_9ACTN|nr:hypothetical protein [Streptomyces violascens]GGU17031.1 hypothetical protein GCM10010289_43470 [Streptomyces violascens]GHI39058.1 hypothetical protein Sviol_34660 [Streptomyces violascens]